MEAPFEYLFALLKAVDTLTVMSKHSLVDALKAHDRPSAAFLWRGLVDNYRIRRHLLGRLARVPPSREERGLITDWCRVQQAQEHPLDQQAMRALRRLGPDPDQDPSPR